MMKAYLAAQIEFHEKVGFVIVMNLYYTWLVFVVLFLFESFTYFVDRRKAPPGQGGIR